MGKTKKSLKVVLDTNVLVSALLFGGELTKIAGFWRKGMISPLLTRETFQEFRRVLEYPKFALTRNEIALFLEEEILPFFTVVEVKEMTKRVCRDPDDDKFIACALAGKVDYLISGDADLLTLKSYETIKITTPSQFLEIFS